MKGDIVRKLLVQAKGEEVRFLVRSFVGNLRVSILRSNDDNAEIMIRRSAPFAW